jgi:hypothetical protein
MMEMTEMTEMMKRLDETLDDFCLHSRRGSVGSKAPLYISSNAEFRDNSNDQLVNSLPTTEQIKNLEALKLF